VIVEPEIVVPDGDTVVAAAPDDSEPKQQSPKRAPRAPKPKRARRSGGTPKGQRLVGLKIGSSQLAAAVVDNDGRPELTQLARTPFEQGIVVDGEVRDEDALADALKAFFAEAKLPSRDVRIGLSSNRIGVRTLEMTGVDDEHFDNAVRFKAHEVLPIAMNESVLDYRVLSEHVGENGELNRRVLLVVAPRDQVEPYVNACRKAGVKLQGIDLEAFALLRAFIEPRPVDGPEQAAIVVVSIGHESTTLVVSGAGVCEFTRVFGWGGAQLDAAIAAACGVSQVEAGAIKTQLSLSGTTPDGVDALLAEKALAAVRTELTLFARELVSSLQFYQKQPDSLGIGEIVVSGGTSQLGGLADSLHTLVGVPVRLGDPLARVFTGKSVASDPTLADTLGSLSVAIGLGIDDDAVRAVNLLPADAQTSTHRRPTLAQALVPAGVVVPVVALAAMLLPAKSQVADRQAELQGLNAELATLPQPQGPGIDQGLKGEQARRAAVVADVLSRRTAWDRVLRQLSLVVPKDIWLTQVNASSPLPLSVAQLATTPTGTAAPPPSSAVAATPTGMTIAGRTFNQAAVARLLTRLSTVPTLTGVQLTRSAFTVVGTRRVVEFEIVANLRGAGDAS
jgi:type IV pilus assembly protein PilM